METADRETMWVDPEFRPLLERAGWNCFDAVMAASEGDCRRLLPQRENWLFELSDGQERSYRVFLKKHRDGGWQSWLRAKLQLPPQPTSAHTECENVARLRDVGIETVRVVAFGESFRDDGQVESFLATEDLSGFLDLPTFLVQRHVVCPPRITRSRNRNLDRLVEQIAAITRRFHQAGYNHRDLYAIHFFVREPAEGQFEIRLIDLHRVQHRRRFRRRWLVKDLAQLAWSLPTGCVSCRHRLAFMRRYFGVAKLRPADKRLIREVLARQQRMQRKLGDSEKHRRPVETSKHVAGKAANGP